MNNDTNQRISVSASYNRAANIIAARLSNKFTIEAIEGVASDERLKDIKTARSVGEIISELIDDQARQIFFKEEAFLKELSERDKPKSFNIAGAQTLRNALDKNKEEKITVPGIGRMPKVERKEKAGFEPRDEFGDYPTN